MKVHIRFDETMGKHVRFTIFVNGGNAGQLCMEKEEAASFYQIVQLGCADKVDEFLGTGRIENG